MAKSSPRRSADYSPTDYVTKLEWLDDRRGGASFDTLDKLDWAIRRYRPQLIEAGEYIPSRGSRPALLGPGFGRVLMHILRQQSAGGMKPIQMNRAEAEPDFDDAWPEDETETGEEAVRELG